MIAQTDLIVGRVVRSVAGYQFSLTIAFKTRARRDVEDSVSAIAVFRAVATGGRLQVVHVLWIELRPDIGSNVGVGQRHAIDGPGHLMAAAHVQLIVHNVSARDKLRDNAEAIALVHASIAVDLLSRDRYLCSGTHSLERRLLTVDLNGFVGTGGSQLKVQDRRATAAH